MVQYGMRNIFWIGCILLIQYCCCDRQNATHDVAAAKLTPATVSPANYSLLNASKVVSTTLMPPVSASDATSKVAVQNVTKNPKLSQAAVTVVKNETKIPKNESTSMNTTKKQWMEGGSLPVKKYENVPTKSPPEMSHPKLDKLPRKEQKHISARKGAVLPLNETLPVASNVSHSTSTTSSTTTTSTTTTPIPTKRPHKMKPFYTMVKGDKFSKDSESFIESPTTGKDYVLPLVLIIFAVPGFVFLVKFLYRRGTEFTERQQYHRMYLIDGDYRPPFIERWKRFVTNFLFGENCQTVNLNNFGDTSLNPRMNYNSF